MAMKLRNLVLVAAASVLPISVGPAVGLASAAPIAGFSYTSAYQDRSYLSERGFASFVVHRDLDGTLSVSGEKLDGEAVAVAISMSLDGSPYELAQSQPGVSTVRVDPDFGTAVTGSKVTLRSGDNARFELQYTPPSGATDVSYNVTIAGAEQAEGNWLVSLHEPAVSVETL